MRLYISILISFLVITANYGQKLDTIFNGYLSPIVQTGGASPNFTFTGAFHNDLGTFDGSEVTTDAVLIMESDGNCYELPIVSLSATGTIISGVVNDPSTELTTIPSGTAAIVRRTNNKSLYPIPAGLPQSTEGCIHTINMLIVDTLSTGGDVIDSTFIQNDSVFIASGDNSYYSGSSFSVLDTTVTAVAYTVSLSGVQEARVIADVAGGSNNITVTLPEPDVSLLGKKISVEQTNDDTYYITINQAGIGNKFLIKDASFPVANIVNPAGIKIGYSFVVGYDANSASYVWVSSKDSDVFIEDSRVTFYDPATSAKQKIKVDYEVDSIAQIVQLEVNNGDNIYVKPTGARYVVQASAVTGYTTDTVAVVPVDGKYAVLQFNPIMYFEYFGVVSGSGKTEEVRRENWAGFKRALSYAEKVTDRLIISPYYGTTYEFHVDYGSGWAATQETNLIIDLNNADFVFYPRVQTYGQTILDLDPYEIYLEIRNGTIRSFKPSFETYDAILSPSGNSDTIVLTASQIRTEFATDVVGKYIYVSYNYDQEADTVVVTGYDPINKILTLERNVTVGVSDDAGWVGLPWDSDTPSDSIDTYEAYWLQQSLVSSTEVGFAFITSISNSNSLNHFKFENIKTEGFYNFLNWSNNYGIAEFLHSDLSAHSGIASAFNDQGLLKVMKIHHCYVHDTGFESKGQTPGHPQSNGDRYNGGTFYTHPNTRADVRNTRFDNCVASYRQYSSSGAKPVNYKIGYSIFENCEFYNNEFDLYNLYTSSANQTPTIINNCSFYGGNLWLNGTNVIVSNSQFKNAPFNGKRITFVNSIFDSLTYYSGSTATCDFLKFTDCRISLPKNKYLGNDYYFISWSPDTLIIDNSYFINSGGSGDLHGIVGQAAAELKHLRITDSYIGLDAGDEFIQRLPGRYNRDHIVTNSTITGDGFGPVSFSNGYKQIEFNNYTGVAAGVSDAIFPNKVYGTTITPTTTNFSGKSPTAATFLLYNTYNEFKANGTAKRIIFSNGSTSNSSQHLFRKGNFRLTATGGSITIPKYNPFTADSVSNLIYDLYVPEGETVELYYSNTAMRYDTALNVNNDTLGALTALDYQAFYGVFESVVIPKTVTLDVGGTSVVDDGNGRLSGTNIVGAIDYIHGTITLEFLDTVPVGYVVASYSKPNSLHHTGMIWPPTPVDTTSSSGVPTGTADFLAGYNSIGNLDEFNIERDSARNMYKTNAVITSNLLLRTSPENSPTACANFSAVNVVTTQLNGTGAVEITIPGNIGSYYFSMIVELHAQDRGTEVYHISEYMLAPLSLGSNYHIPSIAGNFGRLVRNGNDGTNYKIWIGELTDAHSRRAITIKSIEVSQNNSTANINAFDLLSGITVTLEGTAFNTVDRTYFPHTYASPRTPVKASANAFSYRTADIGYTGTFTGALEITFPLSLSGSTEYSFEVDVTSRSDGRKKYYIRGTAEGAGSNTWSNVNAFAIGKNNTEGCNIRFGGNGTYHKVWIGELTDTWDVSSISISNIEVYIKTVGASSGTGVTYIGNITFAAVAAFGTVNQTINNIHSMSGTMFHTSYGTGNKEATDLSKTASSYSSRYATDGTLIEHQEGSGELSVYSNSVPADTLNLTTSYTTFTAWQLSDVYGAVSTSVGGDSLLLKKGTYEIHYDAQWVSFSGQADTAYIITGVREGAGVVTKSLRECYKGSNLPGRTNLVSVTYRTEIAADNTPVSFVVNGDDGSSGGHKVLFEKLIFYVNRIE